jgi:hypothetical protein
MECLLAMFIWHGKFIVPATPVGSPATLLLILLRGLVRFDSNTPPSVYRARDGRIHGVEFPFTQIFLYFILISLIDIVSASVPSFLISGHCQANEISKLLKFGLIECLSETICCVVCRRHVFHGH